MKTLIVEFIYCILGIPQYIRRTYINCLLLIAEQKAKFRNILATNIDLGKHHLFSGRISDALLRFRIAHLLFDTNNKEINYWLGWCYFFKSDYETAIAYLEDSKEHDKHHLINLIKNNHTIQTVAEPLWHIMQPIRVSAHHDNYYRNNSHTSLIDLPSDFIKLCMNNIKTINNGSEILDYGCNLGMVGSILDTIISSKYHLSAIEDIEIFADYTQHLIGERGHIYDQITNISLYDAHKSLAAKKYDLITSFDNLIFTQDLTTYFKSFHRALTKNGHLAILLPLSDKTGWSIDNQSFVFNENDLKSQLKLAEFNILDIKKWKLSADRSFIAFICTNTRS